MSILDDEDELVERAPEILRKHLVEEEEEYLYAKMLLMKGAVKCIITEDETNTLLAAISRAHNLNICAKTSFAEKLWKRISYAKTPELAKHQAREVYSLDCRNLCKGDAYGWLRTLSQHGANDAIVVISNVSQIPDGDRDIYDDPKYVRNILVRSWKNKDIYTGDIHLDNRNMTVILTCNNEDKDILMQDCKICSYGWIGDYNEWIDLLNNRATTIASSKHPELFNHIK